MLSQNNQPELVNLLNQHLTIYKRTNYGKLMLLGGVILIGIVSNLVSLIEHEEEHIAVVQISGEIGSEEDTGNGKKITDHILAAMKNEKAKVIVIEANSPGGAPTDSQTINEVIVKYKQWKAPLSQDVRATILESIKNPSVMFEEIKTGKLFGDLERKPIIAVITKQCASACIQAVINADVIIAQRASLVGSIGVRMDALNWSELAGKLGITNTVITSGELKDALNPWKAIDSNQQQIIKDKILQPIFEQFKNDVLLGRGDKLKVDTEILWSGLAWTGSDAVAFGLVDITSNPIETQAALESVFGRKYQTYSKSTFNLGAFISNPFSSQF
ncbi:MULTISPECIES: S49 family peptidase [unclassified Shewanella]|uniref:S49 family peptidase n=1 Tax=Shewanella TaxID=22 RepID=UPI0021D7DDF6|nr:MULTISPECIES: S49 family peptidase [unclassified Shewanella]MCU7962062.1 S49 family peptidase [Shewanella sp. SW32]MCU7969994.1 S49 family peptidase [Shewanella sp. SW29]MCU8013831.1 S49 family peptidase [Shewanella sp. SM74]MCU8056214.1 S49 family peptidase [Shewanella sp. SM35]MCU8065148.1 S49 family peptidase [Shewanella sp. SM34]